MSFILKTKQNNDCINKEKKTNKREKPVSTINLNTNCHTTLGEAKRKTKKVPIIYILPSQIYQVKNLPNKSGMWVFLYVVNLRITLNLHPSSKILSNIEP